MTSRKRFKSVEEEREYWDRTDVETVAKKSRRPGWKASMIYLSDKDARALDALLELEQETAASFIRHAVREYGTRIAKRHGTTWSELTREPAPRSKRSRAAA